MVAVMKSSSYPYKYKPIRNRVTPLSEGISRKGWEVKEVTHSFQEKKLKDVVAEFGLRAPYDVSFEIETGYEDRKIINCNQKPNCDDGIKKEENKYQVASLEHLIINNGFSKERHPDERISNIGLYKKLLDRAFQLKSAFQCFTFKREDQTKRESPFDKSSIQNQDLSCEHLEQLEVQVEGLLGEYFIPFAREHFTITTLTRKVTLQNQN